MIALRPYTKIAASLFVVVMFKFRIENPFPSFEGKKKKNFNYPKKKKNIEVFFEIYLLSVPLNGAVRFPIGRKL